MLRVPWIIIAPDAMKSLGLMFFYFIWLASVYAQQPGDLDSSFAVNGKLVLAEHGAVTEIVPVDDGILVLAMNGTNLSVVLKLTYDGELDTSFGDGGKLNFQYRLRRIFGLSDGRIITVGNNPGGRISCFEEDGTVHSAYGIDGHAVLTGIGGLIRDADLLPDDRIVICTSSTDSIATAHSSAQVGVIQLDGTVATNSLISFLSITTGCPNGNLYKGFNSPMVRVYGNEIRFEIITVEYHTCGSNPPYYGGVRYRYTFDGILIEAVAVGSLSAVGYYLPIQIKVSSDLQSVHARRPSFLNMIVVGGLPGFLPGIVSIPGVYDSDYGPFTYVGKMAQDQFGRILIPLSHGGTYWTYRSQPFGLTADPTWGHNGFLPAEGPMADLGGAMATAVQPDGKVLSGGYLTIDGEHHFALFRYHNTPSLSTALQAKVILAGPYNEIDDAMKDNLRLEGYLPDTHTPAMGFNAVGNPILQPLHAGVLEVTGDSAVVDWVWLELVSAQDLTTIVASKAALVLRNGAITAEDGHSPVDMNCGEGSFHLRVRHRNHLAVMTADAIDLGADTVQVDLTSPATTVFGEDARMNINGIMMLWPGDVTANGEVKYLGAGNDKDPILISIGGSIPTATITGYHREDVNMDGVVKYVGEGNDRDLILQTIGGAVPTAVRLEQGP